MEKITSILKKLYKIRLKVSRKGTPVLNWSILWSAACLLFAPHMSILGAIAALLLGYEFSIDSNGVGFGADNLEETLKKGAQNVKKAVVSATAAVKTEIEKAEAAKKAQTAAKPAAKPAAEPVTRPAEPVTEPAEAVTEVAEAAQALRYTPADPNAEVLKDLQQHVDDSFGSNPAATTFHSAYSAVAGSVPTIQFPAEDSAEEISPKHQASQNL